METVTMTQEQATEKHGQADWDRTTSQKCSHCWCSIFIDDFVAIPQEEIIGCPHCGLIVKNKFAPESQ